MGEFSAHSDGPGHCDLGTFRGVGDACPGNWLNDVDFGSSMADDLGLDIRAEDTCGSSGDSDGSEDGKLGLDADSGGQSLPFS